MKELKFKALEENMKSKYRIEKLSEDQMLYHYTHLQGLNGIMTSKVIFATEGRFLNDSSEIRYIKKIIDSACERVEDKVDDKLLNEIKWFNNEVKWLDDNHVFVLSLSEYRDSLILWGNYSKNDGYNIGLNPYELVKVFFSEVKNFKEIDPSKGEYVWLEHGKVIYDFDKQINTISDELILLDMLYKTLRQPFEDIADFSISFFYRMSFYSAFFKDSGFSDEREYRIAITSNKYFSCSEDGKGGFRAVSGCLVPYLKVPINSINAVNINPIKEITVGPKNNLDIAKNGLELFLNEYGFSDVEIKKSLIPLRY